MKNTTNWFLFLYRKKASLLVFSVWILVFFSILSVGLYRIIYSQVSQVRAVEERVLCLYFAKAACLYAEVEGDIDETTYDTLSEFAKESKKSLGLGEFIYTRSDEESKLNINTSSVEAISRLPGLNLDLAQNIAASSLRPFRILQELLLVDGITEEIYSKIKDFITVYTDGKININTASTEVLSALGFDSGLVNMIDGYRRGPDYEIKTADDRAFESPGEIIETLRTYGSLSGSQEALLLSLISQGVFVVESKNINLKLETRLRGRPSMKYDIVVYGDRIKEWREY